MNFTIDFDTLVLLQTPPDERTPEGVKFTIAMLKGLKDNYAKFIAYRHSTLFKLSFNGEVIYLEKCLNAVFNNDLPAYTGYPNNPTGIYIKNGSNFVRKYVWNNIENRTDIIAWNNAETLPFGQSVAYSFSQADAQNAHNFIVMIPNAVGSVADPHGFAQLSISTSGLVIYWCGGKANQPAGCEMGSIVFSIK